MTEQGNRSVVLQTPVPYSTHGYVEVGLRHRAAGVRPDSAMPSRFGMRVRVRTPDGAKKIFPGPYHRARDAGGAATQRWG